MTTNTWQTEIITSWADAAVLRREWDVLASRATGEHPFFSYDWFALWYPAYASEKDVRIVAVRDAGGSLRALLPGFLERRRFGRINLRNFHYAANGYSLCGGIIAVPDDLAAVKSAVLSTIKQIRPTPHMLILPMVPDKSPTGRIMHGNDLSGFGRRIEHADVAIQFSFPNGWEAYFASRSGNMRNRIKQSRNRSKKFGNLYFEHFDLPEHSAEATKRLRRLDGKTWQGQGGTGLFSTPENERFYGQLVSFQYPGLGVRVYFTVIDGKDIAYSLTTAGRTTRHVIKVGYDKDFAYCRPGVLMMVNVAESSMDDGIHQIDYGVGAIGDKAQWETERERYINWWLFNRRSLKGLIAHKAIRLRDSWKQRRNLPESGAD